MTTGGDNETRTAVAKALHEWEFGVEPCDVETTGAINCQPAVMNELADAALAAVYSQPWLITLARMAHFWCRNNVHADACSAVPRALLVAAGIEEEG